MVSNKIKLSTSDSDYCKLIEKFIVGIGVMRDSVFIAANTTLLKIFNCNDDKDNISKFFQKHCYELVYQEDQCIVKSLIEQVAAGNKVEKREIRMYDIDGNEKYVEIAPSFIDFNESKCIQIMLIDITNTKNILNKIEEQVALRTSELNLALYKLKSEVYQKNTIAAELQIKSEIFEHSKAYCFVFNSLGECIYISPYTAEAFEVAAEELLGDKLWEARKLGVEWIVESGNFYDRADIINVLNTEISSELRQKLNYGEPLILKVYSANNKLSYMQLTHSLGTNNTMIISGVDVTAQIFSKQKLILAMEQLAKSLDKEKILGEILDKAPAFCIVFDSKGECTYVSPYTKNIFELSAQHFLGNNIWNLNRHNVEIIAEKDSCFSKGDFDNFFSKKIYY